MKLSELNLPSAMTLIMGRACSFSIGMYKCWSLLFPHNFSLPRLPALPENSKKNTYQKNSKFCGRVAISPEKISTKSRSHGLFTSEPPSSSNSSKSSLWKDEGFFKHWQRPKTKSYFAVTSSTSNQSWVQLFNDIEVTITNSSYF